MDPTAVKVPEINAPDASKNALGERRPSGSGSGASAKLGPSITPAELGRRASMMVGDGENRKLRPGEVAGQTKGRRQSILPKAIEEQINQESTPLKDKGEVGPPQIVDIFDIHSAVEGEVGYISVQVQGTPAPTFKFYYKGVTPLTEGIRYKFHTDGETNTVTLCMRNIKSSDEGKYKIVFTNCHGTVSEETQLYVSKPGCTDFRTLLRKSKYAKWGKDKKDPNWGDLKGVQKAQDQFVSPLKDQTAKEGKDKKVDFVAKFSKQNAKAKWFYRQNELFMGVKHKFRTDGDTYQLSVLNPKLSDSGKYMIDIAGVQSSAILTVEAPDPSYSFIRLLNKKYDGFTRHELTLECKVSDPIAIVSWYKDDKKLTGDDKRYSIDKDLAGVCTLYIKSCELSDTGDFRCQLERQPDKTETKVKVIEYPYKFVKCLKSQQNVEKDTITLACELDDPLGDVKWFKGGKEIKPDGDRIQVVKDGRKRKLIIKDAKLSDADQYSCTSNADKTEADIMIKKQNKFNKPLKDTVGVEREKAVFDIEMEDDKAPAEWKLNGKPIKPNDKRFEIKNLGGGKHQLVINDLKLADAGEISVESGKLKSTCKLAVDKGETKPKISAPKEVEGTVGKPLVLEVPYKIDGKKQTPIEGLLLKDGKPLPSKDVEVQVKDDKVIFTIKNPTRDHSGPYQVKLSNGQGEDVKDVKIAVQDVPNAPQDVNVRDVFETSCIVDWKPPKDNGGTPVQKYIIERQDVSAKGKWESAGEVPADKPTTFKVDGLTPKKQYKFRIRAVNKVGQSEPAEFKNTVLAKNPWDEPSKPKNLEVADWDREHVQLKWTKPDKDGGAEITEYEIEVKDKKSKEWVKKKRVPASETTASIDGLEEGQEYEFRVRAINKAGPSEPSDPTKLLIKPNKFNKPLKDVVGVEREKVVLDIEMDDPKAPAEWKHNGKPIKPDDKRFEIKNLGGGKHQLVINDLKLADAGEISVESGKLKSTCKLAVDKGETKPQISAPKEVEGTVGKPLVLEVPYKIDGKKQSPIEGLLLKDGKPLPSKDVEVQVKDDKVIFTIKNPTRDHSGPYQVKLSNGQGEDVKDVKIAVQDVPNAPQDVNVRDVFETSCIVDWKAPKDNGGTPVQKYIIERQDVSAKGKWESAGEVPADKPTTFKVDGLTPKKQYKFRIRAVNKVGPSEPTEFKNTVLAKNPWDEPSKPKSLEITDWDRQHVELKWTKPDKDGGAEITEYEIEIKDKKTKEWVKKKRVPASETTASIDGLEEGQEYEFRVRAINKAGPSEPSDPTKILIKPNKFNKPLKDVVGVEREKVVLDIEMDDPKAPAEWKHNGKPIKPDDKRFEIKNLGGGKHQLVINDLKLADAGEISVESGKLKSTCKLAIDKGETKPQISAPKEVEGTVGKPLVLEVPYKIDGKKQSPIEGLLLKDGKPLSSKDVEVQVKDDKVIFTIKNPTRDHSGPYQIKLSNGQGDDVKDIKIAVQDVPNAPEDVNVRDVFETSCIIDWKAPKDNGGTPVQKYIIERQDVSAKGKWESAGEVPADKPTTFKVDGLTPKKQYKFRIRAVNKVGPSEPTEFKNTVLAKNPWDEPSKPKNLEVTDIDKDHVDLKWTKPDNDGGAEITEYEIEIKDKKTKEWVKKKRVPASETTTSVDGLKEGTEYEFRVRAINKAGPSEPSDATKPVVAKRKLSKPFITGDQLTTVTIKKGQQFKYEIRFGGVPEPEIKWEKNGKALTNDDRTKIVKAADHTSLSVQNCDRSDCGKYKLILTNSSGTIDSVGEVIVLDKPLPPKGPLEVSDVNDKGCKIKWKKPDDDGGSPIRQYIIEKRDPKNPIPGKWDSVSKIPVSSQDLKDSYEFAITGLKAGTEYHFRVVAVNDEGESKPLVTTDATLAQKPIAHASKPKSLEVTDVDKDHVGLKWTKPDKDGGAKITEYEIEVKDKKTNEWVKKKRVAASETTTTVDGLKEGEEYEFRVRAINKAGAGEPSDATKPIVAKRKLAKPFINGDPLKKIVLKKGQTIKYDVRYGGEPEPTVKWEKDGKALTADDRITIENTPNSTILTVRNSVRGDSGKYKLILTNSSGTIDSIGEIIVLDKPSAPKGPLEVTDITEESCKLKWKKPDDDGGVAIKQYKIEKLDTKTGKWSLVTKVSSDKTEYNVTGLTHGPEYKFRVSAVNDEGDSDVLVTENWTKIKTKEIKVVETTNTSKRGAEVGVETYTTEKREQSGDTETITQTTYTTTTTRNVVHDGNRTRTQVRTVKKVASRTTAEQHSFEEEY